MENRKENMEGIIPIKGSEQPYEEGGVLEASHFAKGDGWKGNPAIGEIAIANTAEGIIPIKGSEQPYEEGGVLEASHFAKGDGWKGSKKES